MYGVSKIRDFCNVKGASEIP